MNTSITYKDAGVDIDSGDELVERIKPFAKKTLKPGVLAGIGGFGAMFELANKYKNPVLVSGTDGVGTKLKLAFELNKHDTVGIDLVAMSVNDILVQGAEPLFFLDYFACGKLHLDTATAVIKGIAAACEESLCSLIGGETAEMPSMYPEGEYDLAGFAVGAVEKSEIIDGKKLQVGDVVIGLESNGFHSNGYSLVRKIIKHSHLDLNSQYDENKTWSDVIMAPTKLYVKVVLDLLKNVNVHAMSHITGGGITGNLARVFPDSLAAEVDLSAMPKTKLLEWMEKSANLSKEQMLETFNCGIGYVVVVSERDVANTLDIIKKNNIKPYKIGRVIKKDLLEVVYK
jgi:phosphoribosylformylglycinamidine cyclo-ligase